MAELGMSAPSLIGAPVPRLEGPAKVTGRAVYAADVTLPGALWGWVLRSPYPHARIRDIDVSAAWKAPGVRGVLTGQDVAGRLWGKVLRDMPVLCWDRVRFVGDRVAAVAAESPEAAEAAIHAIHVDYEELPAVFDPLEALEESAPLLHEDVASYPGLPRDRFAADVHNGQTRLLYRKGDVAIGFAQADLVLEHTFRVPARHQGYLEPHASLVAIDADGRVQLWTTSKAPFRARTQLAAAAGIPEDQIRVNAVTIGGDFGGKGDAIDAPIAYFLARQTGRPVKIVMTYGEELSASNPSHPTVITITSGVTRDGRILARTVRTVHASGAYGALKPNAALSVWHHVGGAYRVEHAWFEFLQVYTNTTPGGYFRAPGAHQHTFALESHTDLLAEALGMDPAEFRLRNLIGPGETDAVGVKVREIRAREVLEAALGAAGWQPGSAPLAATRAAALSGPVRAENGVAPQSAVASAEQPPRLRGRGIGLFGRQIGGGPSGSILGLEADGAITVLSPTFDQGVGAHTVLQQLVAAELGVPLGRVRVIPGDTDSVPYDEGPRASRVTYTEGQAVVQACRDLIQRLREPAAHLLDCRPDELDYRDGAFVANGRPLSLVELAAVVAAEAPFSVRVALDAPQVEDVRYFCAQVADVEVDPETGAVRVARLVTAHDVGAVINPIAHQGQIEGGVATGIGLALTEELVREEGRVVNAHLGEYKLPTIKDAPPLATVLVESPGGIGPHAAKAIGELANNSPPAAIANAVANACGVRLYDLPITAHRVWEALQGQAAREKEAQ